MVPIFSWYPSLNFLVPEPVVAFEVDLIATDKVELSWKEPAHPNGIITHYIVSYRPENVTGSRWTKRTVNDLSTTIQVDCKTGATFFTYIVAAVTKNGSKELIGETTQKRYEMCRKFPGKAFVNQNLIRVQLPSCILFKITLAIPAHHFLPYVQCLNSHFSILDNNSIVS